MAKLKIMQAGIGGYGELPHEPGLPWAAPAPAFPTGGYEGFTGRLLEK